MKVIKTINEIRAFQKLICEKRKHEFRMTKRQMLS